ncbi:succinate semialdehyde dehydrogenase NADP+ linked [Puccinia graminis f. sp. tritici]|uniref:succinate-semialdehyde dehydrogenase [NAD(P)(+)] n=1 Tax=Puccinia graminis f. sp. tritici TaxID=56615 RepID=A0A5B0MZT0_PUCGR|nr:succinate semialdehyde dehydrogenase NADP+ linked [Puccinia graminis f. sp. tritici]
MLTNKLIRPSVSIHPINRSSACFSTYPINRSSILSAKLKNHDLLKHQSYINGQWVGSSTSRTFAVKDPATGEEIGSCPDMNLVDLKLAIDAAKKSFSSYRYSTPASRQSYLRKFNQLIQSNAEDLARLIVAENGKCWKDAMGEVNYAASFVDWFAEEALRTDGTIVPSSTPGIRHLVIKQPIGVVAALCPWNFPAAMITRKVAPALAAGCSVIIKAPAETPLTALALAELAHQAEFPAGVFNIVTTQSATPEIGKALCESEEIRKLSFTGSTGVGKLLMSQSSSTLKKLSLELGGNAPFIVFEDADVDRAVEGAIACKFRCAGQACVSANRFYVHKSIYAEFASKLTKKVSELKIGSGFEEGVLIGPLIDERSLEKVSRHVRLAKEAGAEVLIGGKKVDGVGHFFEPTVLSEVPSGVIDDEETFGPVAALYKFESESDVILQANKSEVGLAGYFYSRDIGRIWRVAEALEVGMVGANTGMVSNAVTPFGGIKHSGFGREGSKFGIEEFQIVKYIAMGGL